jgi:AcrR family transcriptional regulator
MNSRKKILEAAITVFSQSGYHLSSMEHIAQCAGVAKGTLYYNFSSKSELFTAAVTEGLETIIAQMAQALTSDLPFHEHFETLIARTVALHLQHRDLTKIFTRELSQGIEPEVLRAVDAVRQRYLRFIAEVLQEGQRAGYLKPLDAHLAAVGLTALLDGLCHYYLHHQEEIHAEQIIHLMTEILSSGLWASAH